MTQAVKTWNPSRHPDAEFKYIDLSAVDNASKAITAVSAVTGVEAPSRARQLVQAGDVLVSTVRPNLNAVALVPPALEGATASTGFTVLRPGSDLDGRFLFYWVRSAEFVRYMVREATGASYPAVSDRIVRDSMMPVPIIIEQRRISAILDHADALRAKRRQIRAHLDALPQSIFHDMFGDPASWPKRWPMGTIGQMAESVQYGSSAKAGAQGNWLMLRMGNVTDSGRLDLTDLKFVDLADRDVPKYTVRRGDMLFNRTNSKEKVGKSCVVDTDAPMAIAGYLIRVRFRPEHRSEFVSAYLTGRHGVAVRQRLAKAAVNQANINANEMRRIDIALPPSESQEAFAQALASVNAQRAIVQRASAADDQLFASLQSRAFRGEL